MSFVSNYAAAHTGRRVKKKHKASLQSSCMSPAFGFEPRLPLIATSVSVFSPCNRLATSRHTSFVPYSFDKSTFFMLHVPLSSEALYQLVGE